MNGDLFGVYRLKPDQIQVVNPVLIILFIPVFEYIVYPVFAKFGLLKKPLQRMVVGGILGAISFIICGFFQMTIEGDLPAALNHNSVHLSIVNSLAKPITLNGNTLLFESNLKNVEAHGIFIKENVNLDNLKNNLNLNVKLDEQAGKCGAGIYTLSLSPNINEKSSMLFITERICDSSNPGIEVFDFENVLKKSEGGDAMAGIVFASTNRILSEADGTVDIHFKNEKFDVSVTPNQTLSAGNQFIGYAPYKELDVHIGGEYELIIVKVDNNNKADEVLVSKQLGLQQGGSYVIVIYDKVVSH